MKKTDKIVYVTAADYTHGRSLISLANQLRKYEPEAQLHVWDLGMTALQVQILKMTWISLHYKTFPFKEYHEHFNMSVGAGAYAWKATVIANTMKMTKSSVIWMDAGTHLTGDMKPIRKIMDKHGIYAAIAEGTVGEWTHPSTISLLGARPEAKMRASGFVGLNANNLKTLSLVEQWENGSRRKTIIAPAGCCQKQRHRFDQSLLSILMSQHGFNPPGNRPNWAGSFDIDWEYASEADYRKQHIF